ncbi:MAG: aldose epimerase family protein [Akkermansia sp.]
MTFYTLQSDCLEVQISDLGARLISVLHQGFELLYGPKTQEELAADQCYCGAICGRVANRIAKGQCLIAGKNYQLPINNGENHLHGGNSGFSDKIWKVVEQSAQHLVLAYTSPDGEEGYPGELQIQATYSLVANKLSLEMKATCTKDSIVNLTNHAYWNLSGEASISEHQLSVAAQQFTPMVDNIPTGEIARLTGRVHDLQQPTRLGDKLGEGKPLPLGFDDNYCLDEQAECAAELQAAGRRVQVLTDAPALQVYTGYYLPDSFGGVALEAQSYPDSPNNPHFPSIEIKAGEEYQRHISWLID